MPKDRFAASNVTRYPLADGEDWVEFKNSLNWGENMRLAADTSVIEKVTERNDDGEEITRSVARTDWGVYQPHRLHAYLSAWSFVGPDEKTPVPVSLDAVLGLDPETGSELIELLDKHLAEQTLKNSPTSTRA